MDGGRHRGARDARRHRRGRGDRAHRLGPARHRVARDGSAAAVHGPGRGERARPGGAPVPGQGAAGPCPVGCEQRLGPPCRTGRRGPGHRAARTQGMATSVVRRSNHYGIAGWYAIRAADAGFIGISLTNSRRSSRPRARGSRCWARTPSPSRHRPAATGSCAWTWPPRPCPRADRGRGAPRRDAARRLGHRCRRSARDDPRGRARGRAAAARRR